MNKNIVAFVNYKCKSLFLSDLILRILGIFFYNYILIFLVQILSPFGYSSVDYFSSNVFPYIVLLTILSVILSIGFVILYIKKSKASTILFSAITSGYISLSLLLPSLLNHNGYDICFQDTLFVFIKILFYVIGIFIYPLIIKKKILPNFTRNDYSNDSAYIWLAPSLVIVFQRILASLNDFDGSVLLTSMYYLISIALQYYAVELFIKAYYAHKYKIWRKTTKTWAKEGVNSLW